MNDYNHELALMKQAAQAAGPVAMSYFRNKVKSWEKAPGDPVSEADHAVNDLLREMLTGARPDYGWLSEEDTDDFERLQRRRVFIVDPIDGTRSFLKKVKEFTICVALVEDGRPIAGVVFNPAKGEMFEAALGTGTRLNGEVVRVSAQASLDDARLLAGRKLFERANWQKVPKNATYHYVNSIAYRMAMIACGRFDGCLSLAEKSDWDIAAAELIVTEAGGVVTTSRHEAFTYNRRNTRHRSLVIAGPALHKELMSFLDGLERPTDKHW